MAQRERATFVTLRKLFMGQLSSQCTRKITDGGCSCTPSPFTRVGAEGYGEIRNSPLFNSLAYGGLTNKLRVTVMIFQSPRYFIGFKEGELLHNLQDEAETLKIMELRMPILKIIQNATIKSRTSEDDNIVLIFSRFEGPVMPDMCYSIEKVN